ncbi:MAG: molybdopterin cofactor-binding domain-containing protein [Pseudomonadales bacterium]|nr:xanthine dehydrogenase family protein molybdopterin-binding subunit [Pseudomonadales bacterium]
MGKWTRRGFIAAGTVAGGALIVGVALRPGNRNSKLAPLVTGDGEALINTFVKVGADNTITVIAPHSEMGQGVHTALSQMLADEMDADWDLVRFLEAPGEPEFANYALGKGFVLGNMKVPAVLMPTVDGAFIQIAEAMDLQITGGSTSVQATGVHGLRVAGAAARQLLIEAAARQWSVPISELTAQSGQILHVASNRRAPFAEFAALAGTLTPPVNPVLKRPEQFTIMGQSKPRLDIPAKVDGSASFGIDVVLPGMKYAAVRGAPVFGSKVVSLDPQRALAMPGVLDVVDLGDAIAVVADGYWQAEQALQAVQATFADDHAKDVDQDVIFAQFRRDMDAGQGNEDRVRGDVAAAFSSADSVVEAEYRVPYLAHACMEPLNATARILDGRCEVWTGSQNPLGFKMAVAEALDLPAEQVTLHNQYLGGGFGRRSQPDYAVQAARIAQKTGHPVKLIWSREEDIRQDRYRPAVLSRFKAALDASGQPMAWQNHFVDKHEPAEATHIPYAIANLDVRDFASPTHVPFGPWRSVDHSQHSFFTESFIDELAHAAGADPYQYRRGLLEGEPRMRTVLDRAATEAGWDRPLPEGWGRGIALQRSFGTIVAQVLEIEVLAGKVRVDRVVCVVDPGFAVSPDGIAAQMESGVIYGLTAALYGEISIENGAVKQSNFHDYPMVRMDDTPKIEVHVINSGEVWGGAGEPGTPTVAPALANAVFDATGTRIRQLPLRIYDLQFRVEEREVSA